MRHEQVVYVVLILLRHFVVLFPRQDRKTRLGVAFFGPRPRNAVLAVVINIPVAGLSAPLEALLGGNLVSRKFIC